MKGAEERGIASKKAEKIVEDALYGNENKPIKIKEIIQEISTKWKIIDSEPKDVVGGRVKLLEKLDYACFWVEPKSIDNSTFHSDYQFDLESIPCFWCKLGTETFTIVNDRIFKAIIYNPSSVGKCFEKSKKQEKGYTFNIKQENSQSNKLLQLLLEYQLKHEPNNIEKINVIKSVLVDNAKINDVRLLPIWFYPRNDFPHSNFLEMMNNENPFENPEEEIENVK